MDEVKEAFEKEVTEALSEATTEDQKKILELPSNQGVANTPEEVTNANKIEIAEQKVTVNPVTGEMMAQNEESEIDKELAKLLDVSLEDLNVPNSINDVDIPDELYMKAAKEKGINNADMLSLIPLLNEYRKNSDNDKISWYDKLPSAVQKLVDSQCIELKNYSKSAKDSIADLLLQEMIQSAGFDKINIDFQEAMKKAMDLTPIMKFSLKKQLSSFETGMQEKAKLLHEKGEIEKAEQLLKVSEAFRQSYTYENFIKAANNWKIKIKSFDMEPKQIRKQMEAFDNKYRDDTPFVITSISAILPVLLRNFGDQFTPDEINRFVVGFVKFTGSMSSHDVVDHTYMSYTISNIISLDLPISLSVDENGNEITEDDDCNNFIKTLRENITKAIRAINHMV